MSKRKKWLWTSIAITIALLITAELFLRLKFGLGKTVVYRADPDFEYIAVPQKLKRFGNAIYYNKYSQRNENPENADTILAAIFGDSVINGGTLTDNDSLATTLLSQYWSKLYKREALILNISAGSWGPDNAYAYLKKYGRFNAGKIVLVVSSHDAYDNMEYLPVVGVHPSYPDKNPASALTELITRYVPQFISRASAGPQGEKDRLQKLNINKKKEGSIFNPGFSDFVAYCKKQNIPLLIYLHPEKNELQLKSYNAFGKQIIAFCERNHIKLVKGIDYFTTDYYRDMIHINNKGQKKLFEILKEEI